MALSAPISRSEDVLAAPVADSHNGTARDFQFLEKAFRDILTWCHGKYSFEELFSACYHIMMERQSEQLALLVRQAFERHMANNVLPVLQKAFSDNPRNLHVLLQQYEKACASVKQISSICLYMAAMDQSRSFNIVTVGTKSFAENCVLHDENIRNRMQETMLEMVERARQHEAVEAGLCKSACNMLVAFDNARNGDLDGAGRKSRRVYETWFERTLLKQSKEVFCARAQELLSTRSLEQFVDGVVERKKQELELCRKMFHESTEQRLISLLHRSMVENHLQQILEDGSDAENSGVDAQGVDYLITNQNFAALRRLCDFLAVATDDGIESLQNTFEVAFIKRATLIITKDEKSAGLAEELIRLGDLFIKAPESFSSQLFNNDEKFEKTIRAAFINAIESGKNKCSESLAFYADRLLQKSNKNMSHDEVKLQVKKIINFFCMLHDKDSFEGFYKQKLSRRLLTKNSFSEDLEIEVVNLLAAECGVSYAQKLKQMFQNLATSRTLNAEYKPPQNGPAAGVDVSVEILQSGAWPIRAVAQAPQLSGTVDAAYAAFQHFYDLRLPNRKLQLVPYLGTAELRATFHGPPQIPASAAAAVPAASNSTASSSSSAPSPRTYLLLINTPQLIILNLFVERAEYTFEEILAETQLDEELCRRNLQALSLAKKQQQRILVFKRCATAAPNAGMGEIAKADSFRVNERFWSPQHRVKVQAIAPPAAQRAKEDEQVREQCLEDRKPLINAALVRVMKARRTLTHNELVSECVEQIKKHFKPDVLTIKARIEDLINEEYFRRSEDDRKILHYIA